MPVTSSCRRFQPATVLLNAAFRTNQENMVRIKAVELFFPAPFLHKTLHFVKASSQRNTVPDTPNVEVSDEPLVSLDEVAEVFFTLPSPLAVAKESLRLYLHAMAKTEGYSELCSDPDVRAVLHSANCISRHAPAFRLVSVPAIVYLIRRRGGHHALMAPLRQLNTRNMFAGSRDGGLFHDIDMSDAPANIQARGRLDGSSPALRPRNASARVPVPTAQSIETHSDDEMVAAESDDDSDYSASDGDGRAYDSEDFYDGDDCDEPQATRRALRNRAIQMKRKAKAPDASRGNTANRLKGNFAVRDCDLDDALRDDIQGFLLTAQDIAIDNQLRDMVFNGPLSQGTVDRYRKDIMRFYGWLFNIMHWSSRDLSLELYANTKLFGQYLQYLNDVRSVRAEELEKQTAVAIRVCRYLSELLTSDNQGNRQLFVTNSYTSAIQYYEAAAKQLRRRARHQQGASVRYEFLIPVVCAQMFILSFAVWGQSSASCQEPCAI